MYELVACAEASMQQMDICIDFIGPRSLIPGSSERGSRLGKAVGADPGLSFDENCDRIRMDPDLKKYVDKKGYRPRIQCVTGFTVGFPRGGVFEGLDIGNDIETRL